MADNNGFLLRVITPDRVFYEGQISMVEFNTTEGEVGILPGHIPMTVIIKPGIMYIQEAEAEKEARINEAEGQAARFNALYEEYNKYPLITKQRMYYETMEQLLPDMKIIIDDGSGSIQKLLPMEPLTGNSQTTQNQVVGE